MKVHLATLENGDTIYSEVVEVNINAKKKKIDIKVINIHLTALGEVEIKNGEWRPVSFTHQNGVELKDKNNLIIAERDAERNILYLTDEFGEFILDTDGNQIPKPRLTDWDKYGQPLMDYWKVPLAQSVKAVQGLNPDDEIVFLD